MTRIITITSGSTQVGKTQLAINLALELARRGHQAGVFQDAAAALALDGLLELHHFTAPHRRITDQPAGDVVRRGYQGVDFLTCRLRLEDWAQGDAARLKACIHDMDTHDGYDDLLIDTSGMEPRALLGCALAAAAVVVVLTPDAHSQAEAFALLRILRLNGFDGGLYLLVNRLQEAQQVTAIRDRFEAQVKEHLGLEITLLGGLAEDTHITVAQRARQAFSSVYPDSEAAAAMVGFATTIDSSGGGSVHPARRTVTHFWNSFLEKLRMPLQLPGQQLLTDEPGRTGEVMSQERMESAAAGTGLVQFDGNLALLRATLQTLPETLGMLAHDMNGLVEALTGRQAVRAMPTGVVCDAQECLQLTAVILNGVCENATQREHVQLQVTECRIRSGTDDWLHGGDYMRFAFRVCTDSLMDRLQAVFARLRLPLNEEVRDSGVLWEQVNPAGTVSLGVSVTLPEEVRLVLWMPARQDAGEAGDERNPAAAGKR